MFNVRIKRFADSEQIQIFTDPLLSAGSEREDNRKVIISTGEICPTNRSIVENPFEETIVKPKFFEEDEDAWIYDSSSVGCKMGNEELNLKRSMRRTKQSIFDISRSNSWDWFLTFTFSKEKVDRYDYQAVSKKMSNWFIQIKRKCPEMKYLVVPEYHKDGAWHFHGLFANIDELEIVDSGKRWSGKKVYNINNFKLGFTTATKVQDSSKASSYITKYTTKDLCRHTKGRKRFCLYLLEKLVFVV